MRILIAPDKFKFALSAMEAAEAIASGARAAAPDAVLDLCPLADGGEGTGAIIASSIGAAPRTARVRDPLGRPIDATWWWSPRESIAVLEMAQAAGLALLTPDERDPMLTTSAGVGDLLRAAADHGAERIALAVGGSATVDGGVGCLHALGWSFLDADGSTLAAPLSGATMTQITSARPPHALDLPPIDVLCDVDNPLLGPRGAAPVFGPQKGAAPADVAELERGLANVARALRAATGVDAANIAHGGAAGGLPAALAAALHARLAPGFDAVARWAALERRIDGCALCITGEGRLDAQTAGGKVVAGVAQVGARTGTPVIALVGAVDGDVRGAPDESAERRAIAARLGLADVVIITPPGATLHAALHASAANLRTAACALLAGRPPGRFDDAAHLRRSRRVANGGQGPPCTA